MKVHRGKSWSDVFYEHVKAQQPALLGYMFNHEAGVFEKILTRDGKPL